MMVLTTSLKERRITATPTTPIEVAYEVNYDG